MAVVSIPKLRNLIHLVGGIPNYYELCRLLSEGLTQTEILRRWKEKDEKLHICKSQFSELVSNGVRWIAVPPEEAQDYIEWELARDSKKKEAQDDRIGETTALLRMLSSGDRKIEKENG